MYLVTLTSCTLTLPLPAPPPYMGRAAVRHPPRPGEDVDVLSMRLIFRLAFDAIEFEKHVHCHNISFYLLTIS